MKLESVIAKLHPYERTVLPLLAKSTELQALVKLSGLQEVEVMRALQWLQNKDILKIDSSVKKIVDLGQNGVRYKQSGLPEKRLLAVLTQDFQPLSLVMKKAQLSPEEMQASIGVLKRKVALETAAGKELLLKRGPQAGKALPEDDFLKKKFPLEFDSLQGLDAFALGELQRRKGFIIISEKKAIAIELTPLGQELCQVNLGGEVINRLTPEMLQTGSWKNKQFRAYDIEINVPKINGGKKHWVTQAIEYAKRIWMDMGFQEMSGNMVQTSFWNFDALFTAQDHPVREMQDTYFLGGEVEKGKLPSPELIKKIQEVHETGGTTGSAGWQYKWDKEEAKKVVLRTHTTVLTAQKLTQLKEKDLPAKLFALGKNFRNEALDWNHLNEFNQTEGIVVDKHVNFCHLLGYLKQFFKKMGFPQARFRPAFFPYTSPSVEIDVYHPVHQKWVEFGGAGMLRPEVVVPLLGKDIPVLAWGPGFDRIILDYWEITNIRDLYKNDLKQIREMKVWLR